MLIDLRTGWLKPVRLVLADAVSPLYVLVDSPVRLWEWLDDAVTTNNTLRDENVALKEENLILKRKLQQTVALEAENKRIKILLNSRERVSEKVLVADLVGVLPDPSRQEIILSRGSQHAIFEGQAVVDAHGLAGHVVEVYENSSRILLIVDSLNAVPVQFQRTGYRAIVEGNGRQNEMIIRHLPQTVDVKKGDLLVSSGLAGRYPEGYPVAQVSNVIRDPGQDFLQVTVEPTAQLAISREFLFVFDRESPFSSSSVSGSVAESVIGEE